MPICTKQKTNNAIIQKANSLCRETPCLWEDVVLLGEHLEHAVHVASQHILPADLAHPREVVDLLQSQQHTGILGSELVFIKQLNKKVKCVCCTHYYWLFPMLPIFSLAQSKKNHLCFFIKMGPTFSLEAQSYDMLQIISANCE